MEQPSHRKPRLVTGHSFSRRASLRIALVVMSALLLGQPAGISQASSTEMWNSSVRDIVFQPQKGKDGFTQAWNISFRGSGRFVVLTYIVSNIGPGSLNNGVSVFFTDGRRARAGTAEFAEADLKATTGTLNLTMGQNNQLVYERGRYVSRARINKTEIYLELHPVGSGVRFSGGRYPVRGSGGAFLQVDVPVMYAYAKGYIIRKGEKTVLEGAAGVEHILTNESPHVYARQFEVTRTFSAKTGIAVGGLHGAGKQPDEFRAAITIGDRVSFMREVEKREVRGTTTDALSGYKIPSVAIFHLKGPGQCKVVVTKQGYIGGFDVLRKVSTVLRWVLRTFFAKPYILHYQSNVSLTCKDPDVTGVPAGGLTLAAQSSYYPVNE